MYNGFSNNESKGSGKFVSIADGKFKIKVPDGTDGSVTRTKENGETVSELIFDKLTAIIKTINPADVTYNGSTTKKLEVSVTTESGDDYIISVNYASSYAITLLRNLTSVDFKSGEMVELAPYSFKTEENGKEKLMIGVSIKQRGEKLKSRFTNDQVPAWKEFMVNGTKTYDKTDQIEFLLKNVNLDTTATTNSDTIDYPADDINTDDIPFN